MPEHFLIRGRWRALLFCAICFGAHAESPVATQLIEAAGNVQVAVAGTTNWSPAVVNQRLHAGDRLRTGVDSRATLRLSDLSLIRVNESSVVQIQAPKPPAKYRFGLQRGALFFLDREKPADVEFQTPLATGAIRGTEFLLDAGQSGERTRLALFDGAVEIAAGAQKLNLTSGEEVMVQAGQTAQVSAVLPAANLIQWAFYYPAVVNPADLPFTAEERAALADSITAYRCGDLVLALAKAPDGYARHSDATRIYFAALKLAVGQVGKAEELIAPVGAPAGSIALVIAAVRFQAVSAPAAPITGSDWLARSYYLQSQSELLKALEAARRATSLAPEFGPAWARLAELEFDVENRSAARQALDRAEKLAPCHAQAVALEGYLALADNHPALAGATFDRALALDGALPMAWLGRALAWMRLGDGQAARRDFETAVLLEPNRGLFRSYLGKAWSQLQQDKLAEKEFALAERLDPGDPTAWLYSALHRFQTSHINGAVRDLEHSIQLNDNRSVVRSRLQLDRDLALRSADLAAIYNEAGMTEVGARAASRAVEESYADFAGHLFLSQSLQLQEDPRRYDPRYETARESELLVANLLAPPGGGNLSQLLSQQERLQYFAERPFGVSSLSEYDSRGYWSESATAFGTSNGFSYAVDAQDTYDHGQRANNASREARFSIQMKDQVTPSDSVYFQLELSRAQSGDVAQHYDPASAIVGLHATEEQTPNIYLGWHHEWSPGSHTLFLGARLQDRLGLTNPSPSVLFLRQNGTRIIDVGADPFFTLQQENRFTLYSSELQQIWDSEHHGLVLGARYQQGSVDTQADLTRLFGERADQSAALGMERANAYGYYEWKPWTELRLTAGLSYDELLYPRNVDLPPISSKTEWRGLLGPKAGFTAEPWHDGWLRGAWSRSLGGLFFDNSIRLEPSQVASTTTAFRDLIPESVEGVVPGSTFDTWTLGFDQRLPSETYLGAEFDLLKSRGSRDVGAFSNAIPFIAVPDSPTSTGQTLDYTERSFSAYANQLLGRSWSTGARYRLSEASLETRLPDLAYLPDAALLAQDDRAWLNHLQLFLVFNHPSGFFAEWSSDWYQQNNDGYSPALPGANFWQHNLSAGYRFAHRRAELRLGVLNVADRDYRLNPLNLQWDLPRRRTFTASLLLNF